ncbi:MAG: membrane protein insertase YidC [Puniceicoccales bacterium]|jgi:YidC/Oxa1 family membrane protein insertase|nr:membrane protein insertase YidC [Puniceicoccales bacterium]
MKDKSQLIGILLLICAFLLVFGGSRGNKNFSQVAPVNGELGSAVAPSKNSAHGSQISGGMEFPEANAGENAEEQFFFLENDVIGVTISTASGAIRTATLKKYRAVQDKPDAVIFNDGSSIDAMALTFGDRSFDEIFREGNFAILSATKNSIKLSKTLANGCVIERQYSIAPKDGKECDGYVIKHEISMENTTNFPVNAGELLISLGTMPATASDSSGDYLNFGTFNGKKDNFVKLRDFKANNGFFGLGKRPERKKISRDDKIAWGSIKNQFFTAVLTPEARAGADGYAAWPISIGNSSENDEGIAAAMAFSVGLLGGNEKKSLLSEFYVGPKDFSRLSAFTGEQDRVMQFGFFGIISELLLRVMLKIHSLIPNWGWTIIVLTTIVKLLLWPLTNAQVRSSKKMALIQQPLKLIREKFKNNPQKLQAETLKLFRENQINPAAGCLPIFIQIPIFFGLYYMLRTASDLRFAHFLWIKDLSLPDTIARIGSFPLNILPLLMAATMFWQMHMTPMPATDGAQKMIFKLMPAIFLLCCYNFPSGLVLYWTVQNLLTIAQQFTTSRISKAPAGVNAEIQKSGEKKHTGVRTSQAKKGSKKNVRA